MYKENKEKKENIGHSESKAGLVESRRDESTKRRRWRKETDEGARAISRGRRRTTTTMTMEAVRAVTRAIDAFRDDAVETLARCETRVDAARADAAEATTRANAREKKLREEMACIRENVEAVMEKARELTSVGDDG